MSSNLVARKNEELAPPPQTMQPIPTGANALAAVTANAEVTAVMASIWLAKTFPRDIAAAANMVEEACKRPTLAKSARYTFQRGKDKDGNPTYVSGASIRLMEMILAAWGNAEAGWREIGRHVDPDACDGKGCMVSECVAFCFDKQTNTRREIAFTVPHARDKWDYVDGKRVKVKAPLTDDRDVYEICANMASRRIRSCIQQIVPAWLVEEALAQVDKTLIRAENEDKTSMKERLFKLEREFLKLGVTRSMLETRLGHSIGVTNIEELVDLRQLFASLRNREVSVDDVFSSPEAGTAQEVDAEAAPKASRLSPAPLKVKTRGPEDTQAEASKVEAEAVVVDASDYVGSYERLVQDLQDAGNSWRGLSKWLGERGVKVPQGSDRDTLDGFAHWLYGQGELVADMISSGLIVRSLV